jgi:hypothetical protein
MNQTDIKILKAETITDDSINGGRVSFASEVISGVKFNLFPRVTSSERDSGVTRYRKAFISNMNPLGETAYGASVAISTPGNGEDRFYIKQGTHSDTQDDLTSDGWTGCGTLAYTAYAGDTSIQVIFKSNDYTIPEGAMLIIKDDLGNTVNIRTSASAPCAEWNGTTATIQLESQLPDGFSSYSTHVGVMIETGSLAPEMTDISVSSASGSFDKSIVTLYNGGTIADTYSITFDSAFSFAVAGAETGALASGTTGSAYEPSNPQTNKPYFSIPSESWSGIFEPGDTVTFTTAPSCAGFWIKEAVPAGCAHEPNNSFNLDWMID